MLECPFELKRYPNPEISWKLPSGVTLICFSLKLILTRLWLVNLNLAMVLFFCQKQPKSNRECLWFANVSSENAGQYTCMAKNKYGNATYSYQVSVRGNESMDFYGVYLWQAVLIDDQL